MTASKWDVPPGAYGPPEHVLAKLSGVTGMRLHIAPADPYASALCGAGIGELAGTAGPGYTLCPKCAKELGITSAAELPVDQEDADWWKAQDS